MTLLYLLPKAILSYGKNQCEFFQICIFSRYFQVILENTKPVLLTEMIDFFSICCDVF